MDHKSSKLLLGFAAAGVGAIVAGVDPVRIGGEAAAIEVGRIGGEVMGWLAPP